MENQHIYTFFWSTFIEDYRSKWASFHRNVSNYRRMSFSKRGGETPIEERRPMEKPPAARQNVTMSWNTEIKNIMKIKSCRNWVKYCINQWMQCSYLSSPSRSGISYNFPGSGEFLQDDPSEVIGSMESIASVPCDLPL